jgi:hypothetical protein
MSGDMVMTNCIEHGSDVVLKALAKRGRPSPEVIAEHQR